MIPPLEETDRRRVAQAWLSHLTFSCVWQSIRGHYMCIGTVSQPDCALRVQRELAALPNMDH